MMNEAKILSLCLGKCSTHVKGCVCLMELLVICFGEVEVSLLPPICDMLIMCMSYQICTQHVLEKSGTAAIFRCKECLKLRNTCASF
jgi:hypothetical protein